MKKLISRILAGVLVIMSPASEFLYAQKQGGGSVSDQYLNKISQDRRSNTTMPADALRRSNTNLPVVIQDKNAGKSFNEIVYLDMVENLTKAGNIEDVIELSFTILNRRDIPSERENAVQASEMLNELSLKNILTDKEKEAIAEQYEDVIASAKKCSGLECMLLENAALGLAINKNVRIENKIPAFNAERPAGADRNVIRAELMRNFLIKNFNEKQYGNAEAAEAMLKSTAYIGGLEEYEKTLSALVTGSSAAPRSIWEGGIGDRLQNLSESIGYTKFNTYETANYKTIEKAFDMLANAGAQAKPIYAEYAANDYPLVARVQGAIGFRRLAKGEKETEAVNKLLQRYYCRKNLMREENEEYLELRRKIVYAYYNGTKGTGHITKPGDTTCLVEYENDLDQNRLSKQYARAVVLEAAFWFAPELIAPALLARIKTAADALGKLTRGKKILTAEKTAAGALNAGKDAAEALNAGKKTGTSVKGAEASGKGADAGTKVGYGATTGKGGSAAKNVPETVVQPKVTAGNAQTALDEAVSRENNLTNALKNAQTQQSNLLAKQATQPLTEGEKTLLGQLNKDIPNIEKRLTEAGRNKSLAQNNVDKINAAKPAPETPAQTQPEKTFWQKTKEKVTDEYDRLAAAFDAAKPSKSLGFSAAPSEAKYLEALNARKSQRLAKASGISQESAARALQTEAGKAGAMENINKVIKSKNLPADKQAAFTKTLSENSGDFMKEAKKRIETLEAAIDERTAAEAVLEADFYSVPQSSIAKFSAEGDRTFSDALWNAVGREKTLSYRADVTAYKSDFTLKLQDPLSETRLAKISELDKDLASAVRNERYPLYTKDELALIYEFDKKYEEYLKLFNASWEKREAFIQSNRRYLWRDPGRSFTVTFTPQS